MDFMTGAVLGQTSNHQFPIAMGVQGARIKNTKMETFCAKKKAFFYREEKL